MSTTTATPRAALKATGVRRRHARTFETELAAASQVYDYIARAEKAEAELAAERARLAFLRTIGKWEGAK